MTAIGESAFFDCDSLYVIYNNSDIELTFGSEDNGYLAKNAKMIVDKEGNKTYLSDEYIDTEDKFLFRYADNTYTLIAYFGGRDAVALPNDIYGHTYEISEMRGITNGAIVVPDCVTSLGYMAFWGTNLTSVTFGENSQLTNISGWAFSGQDQLTSIVIPNGVTYIGNNVFQWCYRLTSVVIPDSVTYIGDSAFASSNLKDITYLGTMEQWNAIDKGLINSGTFVIHCTDGDISMQR